MKIILYIVLLVLINSVGQAQTLSPKVTPTQGGYSSGTGVSLSWTMGETVTATLSSAGDKITQGFQQPEVELLNLTAFLEGFYTGSSTMRATLFNLGYGTDATATDTIQVNLWLPTHLSNANPDYTSQAILHKNGKATVACNGAAAGGSFYLAIKHRNSMETWSNNPFTFAGTDSYDFSTAMTQAYSNGINQPMKNMGGGVFALFGGDVNQDGTIDGGDMSIIDNDTQHFLFGYNASDCNGDGATGVADMALVDNNTQLFLFFARP